MGKLISFSGIDGAGKSTQVNLLKKHFRQGDKNVYVTEEMFGYFLLKPIIGKLRKATKSPSKGPVRRNNNPVLKLWFIPAFFDIWMGYLIKFRKLKKSNDYILADRFYTDIWANLLYYGYAPSWAFEYLVRFLPKADLAFIFDVVPKRVREREDDFPLSYYQEQANIYKRLGKLVKFQHINANKSKNSSFEQIIRHIKGQYK